jgi:enoyl-CoA hydratase/carnithine racemase
MADEDINDYIFSQHEDLHFEIYPNGLAEFRNTKKMGVITNFFLSESLRLLHIIEHLDEVQLIVFWTGEPKVWSAGGDVVALTQLRKQALLKHPLQVPVDDMLSPSQFPSALYTPVGKGPDGEDLPRQLFSGHVGNGINTFVDQDSLPGCAKDINKINTVKGFEASTLETDQTIKPLLDFFHLEYSLLSLLSQYSKPTITLLSGLSYGGGAGISMATTSRLASMSTRLSMPETKIGLTPDVGATYFFNQTSYGYPMGRFLGCTGYNLAAPELLQLGLIDGIFQDLQYFSVFSALKAVPKETLSGFFSAKLPQILVQYSSTVNVLHKDSIHLLKQQQKFQLTQLFLLISTYISPPRDNRPISRLAIYLASNHSPYLAVGSNGQGLYSKLNQEVQSFLKTKSFLFMNLSTILDVFNEESYDLCVQRINAIVSYGGIKYNTYFGGGANSSNRHFGQKDSNPTPNKQNELSEAITLITNSASNVINDGRIQCARTLQEMLAPMCPASCILTFHMSSHLFSRVVYSHKMALQAFQTEEEEDSNKKFQQSLKNIENDKNNNLKQPQKRPKKSPSITFEPDELQYPIYHQYILNNPEKALTYATTPLILNRFISPLHVQHYTKQFKTQFFTSPSQLNHPILTYTDYLNTEFIVIARASLGDFSNFNFFSGVNSLLISKHKSPKWHLFRDILRQYQYLISDMYPMDMTRGVQSLVVTPEAAKLFQEECFLLLYCIPLSFSCNDLTKKFRYFYSETIDEEIKPMIGFEAKL